MMQPIRISQVASTHRCTSHHHQYWSSDMLVIEGKAIRYKPNNGIRSTISTPMMPVIFPDLIAVPTTL